MIPASLYKKIQTVLPIACVDLVVKNSQGEFLLGKRENRPAKGQWFLIGGRIQKGETLKQAALRKAKEELGIEVVVTKMLGAGETIWNDGPLGVPVHNINVVFLVKPKKKSQISFDSQHSNITWFSAEGGSASGGKKVSPKLHPYVKHFLKLANQK